MSAAPTTKPGTLPWRAMQRRAAQVLAHAGEPVSPCVSVCRMNPQHDLCEGCLRSLDEIAGWSSMGADQRRAVWQRIGQRADALQQQADPSAGGGA